MAGDHAIVDNDIPARLDRLPWGRARRDLTPARLATSLPRMRLRPSVGQYRGTNRGRIGNPAKNITISMKFGGWVLSVSGSMPLFNCCLRLRASSRASTTKRCPATPSPFRGDYRPART